MENQFTRTQMLLGKEAIEKLKESKVAIFGIGGVGSFVVEGLVRAGVQNFILVDNDIVNITNINRQLIATTKTINEDKVKVAKNRILEINPDCNVEIHKMFFIPDNEECKNILDESVSYIADCIDTVTGKIELVIQANKLHIPIISSMGTGNKIEPTLLEVSDIYKTSVCPLAKVMRQELRKRDIKRLKVVYSKEEPKKHKEELEECKENSTRKKVPASVSFVPSVAGMIIAGEIVKDLIK